MTAIDQQPAAHDDGTPEVLLEVRGLVSGYGGTPVVHGIDLTVREREIVTILGPNGAGKTTTLLAISGLAEILGGSVEVLGTQPDRKHPHRLAHVGLAHVPEDRGLFFDLTVAENLELGTKQRGKEAKAVTDEVLGYFPALPPLMKRRAGLLSGGEQQMLTLARALVGRPRLLLVDEMSLGLAPIIVDMLLPLLRDIAEAAGVGVLLVEQHVRSALAIADIANVMVHGNMAWSGPARELAASEELLHRAYLGET